MRHQSRRGEIESRLVFANGPSRKLTGFPEPMVMEMGEERWL